MKQALIGTAKGLVIYDFPENDELPTISNVHFIGFSVNMVYVDKRTNRWWVGLSHKHWGQKLHYSDDGGITWLESSIPSFEGKALPNGSLAKLRQVWCMTHAGMDKPGELWLGTEPGGLFYSENNGESFNLVESLWNHPSRQHDGQWFGAGSDSPFIHSIVVDPKDSNHVYMAVSCAGVFETFDGGQSWNPKNRGLVATYLPNPNVEVGHDPHRLLMSPVNSKILWQQNHCGIFFTVNGGDEWVPVSEKEVTPHYGFGLTIDEMDPSKAWVIPVNSDEQRVAPNLKLQVFYTNNFGQSWRSDSEGLPKGTCFDIVLRHAFVKHQDLFLFGTTNGNLFYKNATSGKWKILSNHLTKVNAIELI